MRLVYSDGCRYCEDELERVRATVMFRSRIAIGWAVVHQPGVAFLVSVKQGGARPFE